MNLRASRRRSLTKAITYRVVIVCLDFLAVYLLTGRVATATTFVVVSNIYTSVGYPSTNAPRPASGGEWNHKRMPRGDSLSPVGFNCQQQ